MSIDNQSSLLPEAADREFRGLLLCVWMCIFLVTKELLLLSDFWHECLKKSCDYTESKGPIVTHYSG